MSQSSSSQPDKKRLVVLISGSGSNLQAFIDGCANGDIPAQICCVISNKTDAFGLERAKKAGIKTELINHKDYDSRQDFDTVLAKTIESYQPDILILAGFMRILTPEFVHSFAGKLVNIHPSLLPKYTGLNTHQRAIDAGDSHAGVTVHFVTAELDGGPSIIQAKVAIETNDNADSLAKKVLQQEHIIYPKAIKWLLDERVELKEDGAYLDQKKLAVSGFNHHD